MVGEIRDGRRRRLLHRPTGPVFTTVQPIRDDACRGFLNMGVEHIISFRVKRVLAQRLVRMLCEVCSALSPTDED